MFSFRSIICIDTLSFLLQCIASLISLPILSSIFIYFWLGGSICWVICIDTFNFLPFFLTSLFSPLCVMQERDALCISVICAVTKQFCIASRNLYLVFFMLPSPCHPSFPDHCFILIYTLPPRISLYHSCPRFSIIFSCSLSSSAGPYESHFSLLPRR